MPFSALPLLTMLPCHPSSESQLVYIHGKGAWPASSVHDGKCMGIGCMGCMSMPMHAITPMHCMCACMHVVPHTLSICHICVACITANTLKNAHLQYGHQAGSGCLQDKACRALCTLRMLPTVKIQPHMNISLNSCPFSHRFWLVH